jgi:hypothetical protein
MQSKAEAFTQQVNWCDETLATMHKLAETADVS